MQYWLVKQEPSDYSWADFAQDQRTDWTGVRNYAARNHLKAMQLGDQVLFYHSGEDREVVGLARVTRAAFPDPTDRADEGWVAVELAAREALPAPVSLAHIKADASLQQIALVRQSRLSVMPLSAAQFNRILKLSHLPPSK